MWIKCVHLRLIRVHLLKTVTCMCFMKKYVMHGKIERHLCDNRYIFTCVHKYSNYSLWHDKIHLVLSLANFTHIHIHIVINDTFLECVCLETIFKRVFEPCLSLVAGSEAVQLTERQLWKCLWCGDGWMSFRRGPGASKSLHFFNPVTRGLCADVPILSESFFIHLFIAPSILQCHKPERALIGQCFPVPSNLSLLSLKPRSFR